MSDVLDSMDGIAPIDVAERWFARLMAPDCSQREREQFEAWLAKSPENALAFEDTKSLWAGLDNFDSDDVLGPHVAAALQPEATSFMGQWTAATDQLNRRPRQAPASRWRLRAIRGVAAALILGLFGLWAWKPEAPPDVYVATASIESVSLSDGSTVQLDLSTTMDVRISSGRRDIALRQGRAMFDVAKDASRPFVVDAGVGTITAIGTKFEVDRIDGQVSVTLLEGAVGISTTGGFGDQRQLRLVSGQRARYASSTQAWTVEAADAAALTSWSQGFHVFGATPLRQAIMEINRYSSVKLKLSDPSLGNLVLSGSFKLGDGKAVSQALPYALPVKISYQAGEIVISKR